jgi:hypothetical protein
LLNCSKDYFKSIIDHCRGPDKGIRLHGRRKRKLRINYIRVQKILYFCNQRLKTIPSHISCHAAFSPYFPSEMDYYLVKNNILFNFVEYLLAGP